MVGELVWVLSALSNWGLASIFHWSTCSNEKKEIRKKKKYFGTDRVKKDVATLGLVQ